MADLKRGNSVGASGRSPLRMANERENNTPIVRAVREPSQSMCNGMRTAHGKLL